jgi:hypothetical protein
MYAHTFRIFSLTRLFIGFLLLSIALSACDGAQTNPTTPTSNAVISWPFDVQDGQWAIVNGYRGGLDHAPGGSPNNYALFALDFAKCLPDKVITSQGSEASCDLSSGWANTVGAVVYSPVSGTVAWSDETCHGLSIDIDGHSGYRIVLFHIDPLPGTSWSQLASNHTHFNQGDKIGTVSAGSCIGSGNHIHMALYSCTDCSSDPASQRVGYPFTASWSISNTAFPDDGNTANEYLGLIVPLQHNTPPNPVLVPTPTQPPSLNLEVTPTTLHVDDHNMCPFNGSQNTCNMTLSSPNSNTAPIDWSATITPRPGFPSIIGNLSPSSGTLAPGQQITVSLIIPYSACGQVDGSTITFTGGSSPVVVQLVGIINIC